MEEHLLQFHLDLKYQDGEDIVVDVGILTSVMAFDYPRLVLPLGEDYYLARKVEDFEDPNH